MTDYKALCADLDYKALCADLHAAFNTYAVCEEHHELLQRTRNALAQPEPVLQPIALTEREPEYDSFCWFGHWTGNCWIWKWGTGPHHWQTHWLPANALPIPSAQ